MLFRKMKSFVNDWTTPVLDRRSKIVFVQIICVRLLSNYILTPGCINEMTNRKHTSNVLSQDFQLICFPDVAILVWTLFIGKMRRLAIYFINEGPQNVHMLEYMLSTDPPPLFQFRISPAPTCGFKQNSPYQKIKGKVN